MSSERKTAIIVGIMILVAYSMLGGGITNTKWLVTVFDIVSGLAVIGTAVLMFPFFKVSSGQLSLGYLSLKIVEGVLMLAAGMLFLSNAFQDWRSWIYDYPQTYVFIASACLFYLLLFRTRLVPRFISVWGLVACFTLLIVNATKLLGISYPALDALLILIVTNEVFLAMWLIVKGFNISAIAESGYPVTQVTLF